MNFDDPILEAYDEEQEVLAIVDDWLSTTPEIFGDDEDLEEFDFDYEDDE